MMARRFSNALASVLASALLFCWLGARQPTAAQEAVTRDPQALTLIASSLKALTGGVVVNDVTLQATASYVAGSDEESGTASLTARNKQESRLQLNLDAGPRQEIRNGPAGAWSGPDGVSRCMSTHNCWTDASWFFPALTLEAISANAQLTLSYLGPDSSKGKPLLHVRAALVQTADSAVASATILRLSTMNLYFDPQSFLPLVLDFNVHPDGDPGTDIPVEIQFGNYQSSNGGLVPFHIQKYLQGSLTLDLTISSVLLDSGVSDSAFALSCAEGVQP
jgi:hypothetical protein